MPCCVSGLASTCRALLAAVPGAATPTLLYAVPGGGCMLLLTAVPVGLLPLGVAGAANWLGLLAVEGRSGFSMALPVGAFDMPVVDSDRPPRETGRSIPIQVCD